MKEKLSYCFINIYIVKLQNEIINFVHFKECYVASAFILTIWSFVLSSAWKIQFEKIFELNSKTMLSHKRKYQ